MEDIYRKERRREHDGSPDEGFDIECFEVREDHHQELAEIEEDLVAGSDGHIGHGRDGMADDIYPYDEQYGEEWGDESREEEDDSEEEEELQIDESYGDEEEEGERSLRHQKYYRRYDGLDEDDEEEYSSESKEFPEDEISPCNRLGKDQIDGFSFDFPEEELASDEDDRDDPEYLHHGESEIRYDLVGLTERETCEHERESDEGDTEEYDHIKDLVPGEFPESVEGYIEHTIMGDR